MNKTNLWVQSLLFIVFLSSCNVIGKFGCKQIARRFFTGCGKVPIIKPPPIGPIVHTTNTICHIPGVALEESVISKLSKEELSALNRYYFQMATSKDKMILRELYRKKPSVFRSCNLMPLQSEENIVLGNHKVKLFSSASNRIEVKTLDEIINKSELDVVNKGIRRFNNSVETQQYYEILYKGRAVELTEQFYNDRLKKAFEDVGFIADIKFTKTYSATGVGTGMITLKIYAPKSQKAELEIEIPL